MAICEVSGFRKMVVIIICEILLLKIVRVGGGGGGEGERVWGVCWKEFKKLCCKKKNVESQGGQLDRLCSRDANFFKVCYWTRMSVSALLVPIFRITRNSVSAALSAKVMMNLWVSLAASRCPERLQDRLAISKEKYFHATGSQRFFFHYPFLLPSKLK